MTTVLANDRTNAETMKPKSGNRKISNDLTNGIVRDETRSFLDFPRENLSISHSELEQGFNKSGRCFRIRRQTLLSVIAIIVALVCAGIEIWKLHRVVSNAREIEILRRDVETIKHRIYGKDFMDDKAFEEQLYTDETDEGDDDSSERDIDNADYDNYYEDYGSNLSLDDVTDPTTVTNDGVRGSSGQSKAPESVSTPTIRDNVQTDISQDALKSSRETQDNIGEDQPFLYGTRESEIHKRFVESNPDESKNDRRKHRRELKDQAPVKYTANGVPYSRDDEDVVDGDENLPKNLEIIRNQTTEATTWDRHPPKKYVALPGSDGSEVLPKSRRSSKRHAGSFNRRKELRLYQQDSSEMTEKSPVITRKHLRPSRQVFAAHYGADSSLFGMDDEHTGNGRAKHNEGVFKAWRPSDWVTDLGMTRHFVLSRDGRLTVHEPGLYLIYGQIHYLDEHDENGFHVLVNNRPIMQCMVYSPGVGHKSRSCFSAQITILEAGDHLILKDVGPARYTLFQHDKSFFGLVKLGDSREQQQRQHSTEAPIMLR